jgi:hypothetical protein
LAATPFGLPQKWPRVACGHPWPPWGGLRAPQVGSPSSHSQIWLGVAREATLGHGVACSQSPTRSMGGPKATPTSRWHAGHPRPPRGSGDGSSATPSPMGWLLTIFFSYLLFIYFKNNLYNLYIYKLIYKCILSLIYLYFLF